MTERARRICIALCYFLAFFLIEAVPAYGATLTATWQPNPAADGVTSYALYWGTTSGAHPNKFTVSGDATTALLSGLPGKTEVFVVVTASNPGGESIPSTEVSATTLPDPPGVPTGLGLQAVPVSGGGK